MTTRSGAASAGARLREHAEVERRAKLLDLVLDLAAEGGLYTAVAGREGGTDYYLLKT